MANVHFDNVAQVQAIYARLDALEADGDFGVITRSAGIYSFDTGVVSAFAQTFLNDADAATVRTTIGAAPLASPGFTGTPTAPTAAGGTNTTQIATTAFVTSAIAAAGSSYQASDADLAAIAALASTGFAVRTASNTWAQRSLTAPAAGFTITDGNGVSGNPTFVLANDLAALEGLGSTGIAVRTGTDAWAQRTITGSAGITVSNGDGVSGNPTLTIAFASQAEAEAGSATDKPMNALRVAQAIAALAGGSADLPFITLTSAGGVANAQQIANKASGARFSISSGTDTITATGVAPFVSGDVGKTIVIAGAGSAGADLVTTIDAYTSSTVISIATNASTTIATGSEKGLTWGTPAQSALQSAIDTVVTAGGGAVVIDGHFLLTGAAIKNLSNLASHVQLLGFGSGSRLYVGCANTVDAITFQNAQHLLEIRGVSFVGTTGRTSDAKRVIRLVECWKARIEACGFYGLASVVSDGAIIRAEGCALRSKDNHFGGCGANSSLNTGLVDHVDWRSVEHDGDLFIDYGQLGAVLHEKTAGALPLGWVVVRDHSAPDPPNNMRLDNLVKISRVLSDEGVTYSFAIQPTSGRIGRVLIEESELNVGGGDTARAVHCVNVDDVEIRKCWGGWASNPNVYIAGFSGCGRVLIDGWASGLQFNNDPTVLDTLLLDNVDDLTIRDCPAITTFTSLTDPGSSYMTRYHPVDSRYFPYALIKATGTITDADFIEPPAPGTRALVKSTGIEYTKKLKTEGWLEYASTNSPLYGPQLVVNGDGSSTVGWTTGAGSLAATGGVLRITSSGGTIGYFSQVMAVDEGEAYELDIDIVPGTGSGLVRIGNFATDNQHGELTATPGSPLVIVANASQIAITCYVDPFLTTVGLTCDFDNISLRAA